MVPNLTPSPLCLLPKPDFPPSSLYFTMPGKTFFDCDRVEFASVNEKIGHVADSTWQPAKVYVSEVTDDSRE